MKKNKRMVCRKCKSENVKIQILTEMEKRSLASTAAGLATGFWLFQLLRGRKTTNQAVYMCQDCGHYMTEKQLKNRRNGKWVVLGFFILVFGLTLISLILKALGVT